MTDVVEDLMRWATLAHDYDAKTLNEAAAEIERLRSEGLSRGNALGRIAVALFGDQNNRTDEECVSEAAAIGYALTGCREKVARQAAEIERLKAEIERRDEGIAQQVLAQKIEIERLRGCIVKMQVAGQISNWETFDTVYREALGE